MVFGPLDGAVDFGEEGGFKVVGDAVLGFAEVVAEGGPEADVALFYHLGGVEEIFLGQK